jgi:hypothetical protein
VLATCVPFRLVGTKRLKKIKTKTQNIHSPTHKTMSSAYKLYVLCFLDFFISLSPARQNPTSFAPIFKTTRCVHIVMHCHCSNNERNWRRKKKHIIYMNESLTCACLHSNLYFFFSSSFAMLAHMCVQISREFQTSCKCNFSASCLRMERSPGHPAVM